MIEVELPDGMIAEFPDGTSRDVMKRALQKRFEQKSPDQRVGGAFDALPEGAEKDVFTTGTLLPVKKNRRTGEFSAAIPGFAQSILDGVAAPGRALRGELQVRDADGKLTDEAIGNAFAVAGAFNPAARTPLRFAKTPVKPKTAPVASEGQLVAEAGERLGVDLPRAVTSDLAAVQQTGKIAASVPIGGTPLRAASAKAIDQLSEAATGLQNQLGSGSPSLAGGSLRQRIGSYISENLAQRVSSRYDAVDELVNPLVTRPLSKTAQKANQILARRRNAAIGGESQAVKQVFEALERPEGLTYEGLKNLRTAVREMLDEPSALPARNISQNELKQIYAGLTDDLKSTVAVAGGPKATKAFNNANNFAAKIAGERLALNKLLKVDSDEALFEKVVAMAGSNSRANIRQLGKTRAAVTADTWDEVSSAVIARLGRGKNGEFSPDRFVSQYGTLSKQGKLLLFGRNGTSKALDDIAAVSSRFKQLQQFANPSGTASHFFGGALGVGSIMEPTTALTAVVGARTLSNLLARPRAVKSVAAWAKAYENAVQRPSRVSTKILSGRAQPMSVVIARELGDSGLAPQIAARLESVVPAAADKNGEDGSPSVEIPE